jgi:hypothetical protein
VRKLALSLDPRSTAHVLYRDKSNHIQQLSLRPANTKWERTDLSDLLKLPPIRPLRACLVSVRVGLVAIGMSKAMPRRIHCRRPCAPTSRCAQTDA